MNVELTTSQGLVCVPRTKNGIMANIGTNYSECWGAHIRKEDENQFKTFNCIMNMYLLNYTSHKYYLAVQEKRVDWGSRHKFLPLDLRYEDYIKYKKFKSGKKWKMVPEKFEINDCIYFLYANDFNIFESLIRDGLINGSV
jgi:hypothetical protein